MNIKAIDTFPLVFGIKEIYGGAAGYLDDCRTFIVRIECENGIEGWGEATQGRPGNTYETLETMDVMVRGTFAPALVGRDLEDTGSVLDVLHGARYGHPVTKAAVEMAMYDALGKLYGVPVYRLLSGPYHKSVALVGGLGLDEGPDAIGTHAATLQRQGFETFKIKIGQKDKSKDIDRVASVRQAVGDAAIRVDGNACYSYADAREILTELARYQLTDAEQPLLRGDLEALAELRRVVPVPIAVQESVSSPEEALQAMKAGAADLMKVKATHIGGFRRALRVGAVTAAGGLPLVIGQGSACTPLLSMAEMHLHAALPNAQPAGEMTGFLRVGEQNIMSPIEVVDGRALLSDKPGFGIDVDREGLRTAAKKR